MNKTKILFYSCIFVLVLYVLMWFVRDYSPGYLEDKWDRILNCLFGIETHKNPPEMLACEYVSSFYLLKNLIQFLLPPLAFFTLIGLGINSYRQGYRLQWTKTGKKK